MRDMILIVEKNFNLNEVGQNFADKPNYRVLLDMNRMSIESSQEKEFVQFERSDEVSQYYDDEECKIFASDIPAPDFYIIRFKNVEFLKQVLMQAMNRPDIYLDNDFGLIMRGNEFVELVRQRPGWDWADD